MGTARNKNNKGNMASRIISNNVDIHQVGEKPDGAVQKYQWQGKIVGLRRDLSESVTYTPDQPQADRKNQKPVGEGFGTDPDVDH
jgi:hypothetical protein